MLEKKRPFFQRLTKKSSDPTKDLTMRQVLSVSTPRSFPSWKQWKQLGSVLTRGEKQLGQGALWLIIFSLIAITLSFVLSHRIEIPTLGGEYTEGLIGEPQFINPLYASTNDVDADLASLVYSGLMRWDPSSGLVADLAESYNVSEDRLIYTFHIRENATFHNGDPVRAQDVLFTINAIQNPAYRSPLIAAFKDISVNQDDDRTVSFVLKTASANFLNTLTIGILPSGVWAEILPQNAPLAALNLQPIGSGPYEFAEFSKDKRGSIRSYTLKANDDFYQSPAHVERLTFKFYADTTEAFDALDQKYIEGVSVIPFEYVQQVSEKKYLTLHQPPLPEEIVLFFNQKTNPQLADLHVRTAIASAIDRSSIISSVFHGTARAIETPLLPGMVGYAEDLHAPAFDLTQARVQMEDVKLPEPKKEESTTETTEESTSEESTPDITTPQHLPLTLTIMDLPEYQAVAELLKQQLAEINIDVTISPIAPDLFSSLVVEPRDFELLLGSVLFQADPDPYLFWHSSQIEKNGLNLASYQNKEVDGFLEKARVAATDEERATLYHSFQEQVLKDLPALFLYQSTYPYATPKTIQQVSVTQIRTPQDRFASIRDWYIKTKKALK